MNHQRVPRALLISFLATPLAGCCFGGGGPGATALAGPGAEVAFGRDIQHILDLEVATLNGAPTPPEFVCATPGWSLGERELDGADFHPMGAGTPEPLVAAYISVETVSAGHPRQGMTIDLLLQPSGEVTWISVREETPSYGSTAPPADAAWLATHVPSVDALVARTIEGLEACSLPRASVGLLAQIASASNQAFMNDWPTIPLPCMSPTVSTPPPQQIDAIHIIAVYENGTYHPVVNTTIGSLGSGGADFHTCAAVTGVRH